MFRLEVQIRTEEMDLIAERGFQLRLHHLFVRMGKLHGSQLVHLEKRQFQILAPEKPKKVGGNCFCFVEGCVYAAALRVILVRTCFSRLFSAPSRSWLCVAWWPLCALFGCSNFYNLAGRIHDIPRVILS
ncbi:uncharacterized protein LOC130734266 isoform X2 [Lotus japonicus]|uniref:uncharacterized protein LOC130734266 isoform X2 n=1 Tax=Lotus japonicus TaxID=34305 RepID=UPI0025851863|nr:uncharacterized protein LOC130734266 isoform X2 [Lotus japonicus]